MDKGDQQPGASQQGNVNTGNVTLRDLLNNNTSNLLRNPVYAERSQFSNFTTYPFNEFQLIRNNNEPQPTSTHNNQKIFEAMRGCSRTTIRPELLNKKRDQSVIRFNHGQLLSYLEPKPKKIRFNSDMPYGNIRFPFPGDTKKISPIDSLGERKGRPTSTCTVTSFTAAVSTTSAPTTEFKVPLFTSDGKPTAGILGSPGVIKSTPQDSDTTMKKHSSK